MMIDDDDEDQWIIREALVDLNAEELATFASNGEEALALLDKRYSSQNDTPKLIILDLNMPIMNGTATLARLKADERFRNIPVIIYSTSVNPFERDKCMELGAHSYIIKPISIEESALTMQTFLSFCQ